MALRKLIICVDFDGVIHSYKSGWKGPRNIPDPPVPGAIRWLEDLTLFREGFEVHIFSSRSRYWFGRNAMKNWLIDHGLSIHALDELKFPLYKPPAHVTIDDRAIQFNGFFPKPESLRNFKPWHKITLKTTEIAHWDEKMSDAAAKLKEQVEKEYSGGEKEIRWPIEFQAKEKEDRDEQKTNDRINARPRRRGQDP